MDSDLYKKENPMFGSTQTMYTRMRTAFLANREIAYWPLLVFAGELTEGYHAQHQCMHAIVQIVLDETSEAAAAARLKVLLGVHAKVVKQRLVRRINLVVSQVGGSLRGATLLDFGCQSGEIGFAIERAAPQRTVSLYDVHDARSDRVRRSGLEFRTTWEEYADRRFDEALVLTVLHHCDEPELELGRLADVTPRLVIVESVVSAIMPWPVQALIDWLYNRGLNDNPVPGNFRTVDEWVASLRRVGYTNITVSSFGVDIRVVPEFHVRILAERPE